MTSLDTQRNVPQIDKEHRTSKATLIWKKTHLHSFAFKHKRTDTCSCMLTACMMMATIHKGIALIQTLDPVNQDYSFQR